MPAVQILSKNGEFGARVRLHDRPGALWLGPRIWRDTEEAARADAAAMIEVGRPGLVVSEYEVPPAREPSIPQPAPDSSGELGPFAALCLGVALGAVLAGFAVGLWVAR